MKFFLPTTVAASLVAASCSPHKVTKNPKPPIQVPEKYQRIQAGGANLPDRWWQDFSDPALDALVDAALVGNLQVKAAWERLKQARAGAKQAGAARWPILNLTSGISKTEPANPFFPSAPLGLEAAYEVDIFKRLGNTTQAAVVDTIAARDQVESLAMSLVSQIAETWYQLVSQRARLKLLDEQVEVSANFLELAEMRLGQGLGSSVDVLQQRRQLAAVAAQRPLLEASLVVLENQLGILTGKAPGTVVIAGTSDLPELPSRPSAGVPADLLLRRPDVRAAQMQVEAADYRVAAAVAARLPSLRLSGNYGPFQRFDAPGGMEFEVASLWTIAANLVAPLIDGGRRKAAVTQNKALVRERSYAYGQTLLQAMLEVQNALTQESKQLEYIEELRSQLVIAEETLEEARQRYGAGIGDQSFLQILTALSTVQQIQQTLIQAHQQALSFRIQLCRALGGTWTRELGATRKKQAKVAPAAGEAPRTSMRPNKRTGQ